MEEEKAGDHEFSAYAAKDIDETLEAYNKKLFGSKNEILEKKRYFWSE